MLLLMGVLASPLGPAALGRESISLEGRLRCLAGGAPAPPEACVGRFEDLVLQTDDGELHRFDPSDPRAAILPESRLFRERLHVSARRRGGRLEIIDLHIIRPGGHVQPHYRCDVCNITAYAPGPCWCCGEPFEYREKPASEPRSAAVEKQP